MNSDIDHMLGQSPEKMMDESFEELSRDLVLPVPESIPEKPQALSKKVSIDIPLMITSLPLQTNFKTISPSKSITEASDQHYMNAISSPQNREFVSKIPRIQSRGSSKSPGRHQVSVKSGGFKSVREQSKTKIKSQSSQLDLTFNQS